jgi:nucleoside-diphosphate-sugar epimerase
MINDLIKANGFKGINKKIPTGVAMPLAFILEVIHKISFIKSPPRLTRFLIHELTSSHWFDITAARKQLGYSPDISIQEGLQRLRDYEAH